MFLLLNPIHMLMLIKASMNHVSNFFLVSKFFCLLTHFVFDITNLKGRNPAALDLRIAHAMILQYVYQSISLGSNKTHYHKQL